MGIRKLSFKSLEEEVAFLRAWAQVTSLVDEILEDCLEQRMGLRAALDVFLTQCARLVGAAGGFVHVLGSRGPVLTLVTGSLDVALDAASQRPGIHDVQGGRLFVKELALGATPLGAFGLSIADAAQPEHALALVSAMGEVLDTALLGFLALSDGRPAARLLDELAEHDGFQPHARLGRYELLVPLGSGGMGQVFVARQEGPDGVGRLVALKRVLPHLRDDAEAAARFLDEGRIGLRFSHPNLITVYDFGRSSAGDYLAMELVRGVTLRALVDKVGRVQPGIGAAILWHALQGLHAAHQLRDETGAPMGLVHRDLSPRNVMIGFDGRVKVLDFGVAKTLDQRALTAVGEVRGKVRYLSPEQVERQPLDRRSDLFTAGVLLYEALTGRTPFDRPDPLDMLDAIVEQPAPPDERIPVGLWPVLLRALAKDRKDRPDSAKALADQIAWAEPPTPAADLGAFVTREFPEMAAATSKWAAALPATRQGAS